MTAYDLEHTYLGLDGHGGVTPTPGGAVFWQRVDQNPLANGTLVTVIEGDADWRHWEMHPSGDEVLVVLQGRLSILFQDEAADTEHKLAAGATLIIPKGIWHRATDLHAAKLLFITYGLGTGHKPVTA